MRKFMMLIIIGIAFSLQAFAENNFFISNQKNQIISQGSYNFGLVPVNYSTTAYINIFNNSTIFMNYDYSNFGGIYFNSNHNCYFGLNPGQSCSLQISYWPNSPGYHNGYSSLHFSANQSPYQRSVVSLQLYGQAIR